MEELVEFAARTPFQIEDIGAASKQLLAFGVDADDITDKLEFLGDIASGAGISIKDLTQIYGKSMAKGKAQTEELMQMSERGIPIMTALVELGADYGKEITKADIFKAAERTGIEFEIVVKAMKKMTAEGGVFNEQMQKQSETMSGLGIDCEGQRVHSVCRTRKADRRDVRHQADNEGLHRLGEEPDGGTQETG